MKFSVKSAKDRAKIGRRPLYRVGLLVLLLLMMSAALTSCDVVEDKVVTIGVVRYDDNSTLVTSALGRIWNELNMVSEIRNMKHSIEACKKLDSGKLSSAIIPQCVCYQYVAGVEAFEDKGPSTNIRALTVLGRNYMQAWALDPDIRDFGDLDGKTIFIGPEGGEQSLYLNKVLKALGATPKNVIYGNFYESGKYLYEGKCDVVFGFLSAPSRYFQEDYEKYGAHLLWPTDVQQDIIVRECPVYSAVSLGSEYGEFYDGMHTVCDRLVYCVSTDIPDELTYNCVSRIYRYRHLFSSLSYEFDDMDVSDVEKIAIILCNGSYKFFLNNNNYIPNSILPDAIRVDEERFKKTRGN